VQRLARPVTHAEIKREASLAGMALMRLSRLSVQPVTEAEWKRVLEMSETPPAD
jgi:predicted RNA-binding protein with PUA-like domain